MKSFKFWNRNNIVRNTPVREYEGIGVKQYLEQTVQPTYTTLTKERLDKWVTDITNDMRSSDNI